ncbi:sensor histidine kinase [Paenibacillus donghaensis]|uniref:Histidine kinase/HSP90-like ATPase domain-containing protein n=1 Tax=Paenibacillus donghaensis TaxID=414771 RepID=A0A2Z2KD10_9BACL|nr:hypothetical protein [Paenibacillus donghaensis]ASA20843.1 hypothetical protein B9T62_08650 [Paenibacillus donghaensis]
MASHAKTEGVIHILISKDSSSLICEVVDSGDGMDTGNAELPLTGMGNRSRLFSGIGINNVHER